MFISFFLLFLPAVNAAIQIRYLFNNGASMAGVTCTENDKFLLTSIFQQYNYRNLRQASSKVKIEDREMDFDTDVARKHKERQLPYYPPECKNACKGFAPNTCAAANCKGYRRELAEDNEETNEERNLQMANACQIAQTNINIQLTNIINSGLSASCKPMISAPRSIECYDDVQYGEIVSFSAYKGNAYNTQLATNLQNGYEVCKSQNVNFEAVGNICTYTVTFVVITAQGGRIQSMDPFAPFTSSGDSNSFFYGGNLQPGTYTLQAYPNSFSAKTKQITFIVKNC